MKNKFHIHRGIILDANKELTNIIMNNLNGGIISTVTTIFNLNIKKIDLVINNHVMQNEHNDIISYLFKLTSTDHIHYIVDIYNNKGD